MFSSLWRRKLEILLETDDAFSWFVHLGRHCMGTTNGACSTLRISFCVHDLALHCCHCWAKQRLCSFPQTFTYSSCHVQHLYNFFSQRFVIFLRLSYLAFSHCLFLSARSGWLPDEDLTNRHTLFGVVSDGCLPQQIPKSDCLGSVMTQDLHKSVRFSSWLKPAFAGTVIQCFGTCLTCSLTFSKSQCLAQDLHVIALLCLN